MSEGADADLVDRLGVVPPADQDPLVASVTERIGGRLGRRVRVPVGFWTPLRTLVLMAGVTYTLGYVIKLPCRLENFSGASNYVRLCYTDIPPLFSLRGFAEGSLPYIGTGGDRPLEYPVLTGFFMQVAAWLTGATSTGAERTVAFYDWNVLLLLVCLLVAVVATALTVKRRPWDAALVALAPGVLLTATINWDLLAVALTSVSMLLWARKRPGWAGVLLGLAIAAKFYPVLLLGPLLVLCLRAGRLRAFLLTLLGVIVAWAAVNVPIMLASFDGWAEFYTFSQTRGADWGSFWYVLLALGHPIPPDSLNTVATGILGLLCVGIVVLAVAARKRPRYAQLAFLVVAAFCLTNKVYSPQYVLWLIPLAALARPRWRDFLIWQAGEVVYFLAIWYFLLQYGADNPNKGLNEGGYIVAILLHLGLTAWFCAMVVRDVISPRHDPIRSDGVPEHADDPGGGVLDGAPDWISPRWVDDAAPEPTEPVEATVGAAAPPTDDDVHSAYDDRA